MAFCPHDIMEKNMKSYRFLFVGILVSFLFGVCIGGKKGWEQKRMNVQVADLLSEHAASKDVLAEMIRQKDYSAAAEYINLFSDSQRTTDALANSVGRSIYEEENIHGFSTCFAQMRESALRGCLHGLISSAISQGPQVYSSIHQGCMSLPKEHQLLCIRSIGQAIAAGGDYSLLSLNTALKDCEQFPFFRSDTITLATPCQKGVFAEHFMTRAGIDGMRSYDFVFDENNPYDICPDSLNPDVCYGQIVPWWFEYGGLTQKDVALLCFGIDREEGKRNCIVGLTDSLTSDVERQLDETVQKNKSKFFYCQHMPVYGDQLSCYQNELIMSQERKLTELMTRRCRELDIGEYTQMCAETTMIRILEHVKGFILPAATHL